MSCEVDKSSGNNPDGPYANALKATPDNPNPNNYTLRKYTALDQWIELQQARTGDKNFGTGKQIYDPCDPPTEAPTTTTKAPLMEKHSVDDVDENGQRINYAFEAQMAGAWPYKEYEGCDSEFNKKIPSNIPNPKKLMVVSSWRGGYNFIGELLERHPDVFYLNEPFVVTDKMDDEAKEGNMTIIMENYFDECKLPRYSEFRDDWRDEELLNQNIDCNKNNFCFRSKGLKYKSKPICGFDFVQLGLDPAIIDKECPLDEKDLSTLEGMCTKDKVRVIKESSDRLNSLSKQLTPDQKDDPGFSVYIFVRDPRGLAFSRRNILGEDSYKLSYIEEDCKKWEGYIKDKFKNTKWQMDVKFLRYEDFTNDPDYQAKELFNTLGLELGDDLSEFLYQEAHMGYGKDSKAPFIYLNDTFMDTFSTLKGGSSQPYAWLKELTFKEVDSIQKICSRPMEYFGYKILDESAFDDMSRFFEEEVDSFKWNMDDENLPVNMLYGKNQRENSDKKFLADFGKKPWGWGASE